MTLSFKDALLKRVEQSNVSLKSVADGAGVSYEQLKKLKQNKSQSTNVDDALKIARHFGMTLDGFLEDETAALRSEIASLWDQLSQEERDFLMRSAKGVIASRPVDS